jgi:hypothetical protein
MWHNPVMLLVEIGAVVTTLLLVREPTLFQAQIAFWLWATVLFANFAEAIAEGRGKAQADSLRRDVDGSATERRDRFLYPVSEFVRGVSSTGQQPFVGPEPDGSSHAVSHPGVGCGRDLGVQQRRAQETGRQPHVDHRDIRFGSDRRCLVVLGGQVETHLFEGMNPGQLNHLYGLLLDRRGPTR